MKFTSIADWFVFGWNEFLASFELIGLFFKAFGDKGQSYNEMLDLIDTKFFFRSWTSVQTDMFIRSFGTSLFFKWDFKGAWDCFVNYLTERWNHFTANIKPFELINNIMLFFMVGGLDAPGKFSLASPLYTAYFPTLIGTILIFTQFILNIVMNDLWAQGNLYLISIQLFTIMQYIFMGLTIWNFDTYLYDLRPLRYIVLGLAIEHIFFYVVAGAVVIDLVFIKNKSGDIGIFDTLASLFIGYNLIEMAPTLYMNVVILLKEMTLN